MRIGKMYHKGKEYFPVLKHFPNLNTDRATKLIHINQTGYDVGKSKRATITNLPENSVFYVKKASNDKIVYRGILQNQKVDFSKVDIEGNYYIECCGIKSYNFKIGKDRLIKVGIKTALDFMEQSRQENWDIGGNTGYAWRDSHQFCFELNSLVLQYMSNPNYYKSLEKNVYKCSECDYEELRTQTEPNIVWLIKYGALRYIKLLESGTKIHALIKGQSAWFLYGYQYYREYVSEEFYNNVLNATLSCWEESDCTKTWYDVDLSNNPLEINHNMLATQNIIGTVKGQLPPGYAVVPNLLMYKVTNQDKFKTAFLNNMNWLLEQDLTNPKNLKGQRMSELQVILALTQPYKIDRSLCPNDTLDKIKQIADLFIKRSDNMWDYKMYQVKGEKESIKRDIWVNEQTSGGLCNQPGNTIGMLAECFSIAECLEDREIKNKIKQIGVSNYDHCFGRNPTNSCYFNKATTELEDAKKGWPDRMEGGFGDLGWVTGVIDGSPKEGNYPYNPDGNLGYTEAWVVWNTCWNTSLAYLCAYSDSIESLGFLNNK